MSAIIAKTTSNQTYQGQAVYLPPLLKDDLHDTICHIRTTVRLAYVINMHVNDVFQCLPLILNNIVSILYFKQLHTPE